MRKAWGVVAGLLLICGAAHASEIDNILRRMPANDQATVGIGLICDTSEQAVRFITLRANGTAPQEAMATVNAEAKQPRACGIAAVAFVPVTITETKTLGSRLVRIVRVNVVAGFNGVGWQPVTGLVQYAVILAAGVSI